MSHCFNPYVFPVQKYREHLFQKDGQDTGKRGAPGPGSSGTLETMITHRVQVLFPKYHFLTKEPGLLGEMFDSRAMVRKAEPGISCDARKLGSA